MVYVLVQEGYQVILVECYLGLGEGISYVNGGQLSYSYVVLLVGFGVFLYVLGWLLCCDLLLCLKLFLDLVLLCWGLCFIVVCNCDCVDCIMCELFVLLFYSCVCMEVLWEVLLDLVFSFVCCGKLVVYCEVVVFEFVCVQVGYQVMFGCEQYVLFVDEVVVYELVFVGVCDQIVGVIYMLDEDVVDCY